MGEPDHVSLRSVIETIAIGLLLQAEETNKQTSIVLLLNDYLRHGWEQLCYLCYEAGTLPPQTLPDLVNWLHQPIERWTGIGSAFQTQGITGTLLNEGRPTHRCEELGGVLARDSNPRLALEDENFRRLHLACQSLGKPKLYSAARYFIGTHPVLTDPLTQILTNPKWESIRSQLKACYEEIPRACWPSGQIVCCPICGWALEWNEDQAYCHTDGVCAERFGDLSQSSKRLPYTAGMLRTKAGIQRYVVAPEVELVQLYRRLKRKAVLHCTLYPAFDTYDLRIVFPDGEIWAVDLKDHRSPKQLAKWLNLYPFPRDPKWHRAFYLFPKDRGSAAYRNVFKNHWMKQEGVSVMNTTRFMRLVNQKLER